MLTLRSILRKICQFFKSFTVKVTKKMYRSSAVFMAGTAVITVIAFTSAGFGNGGKNAMTALAQTPAGEENADEEAEEDITAASTDPVLQAQQLAGDFLEKEVIEEKQEEEERVNFRIAMEEEAKQREEEARQAEEARLAAEEAARKAEEEKALHAMSVSEDDYSVLLKIVQAEAGVCDDQGKILVANVILNRVKSGKFSDTVRGVVYSPSQFSPVSDGSINSVKVTEDTIQCVNRALDGEDYSDGALYFMNRGGSRKGAVKWFDSHLTYLFRHGNHEFFK